ncbi:CRACD-like protein isoform X2 [Melanotaenia boesemani]|uniref:CRACD-like protein isoform X2 n=1 Tax=Melanotaenia boesemani TaxID=1250792 RepID=UPI001C059CA7|nr:CRACD-like protein isoform X2 [Melanotaenia boesemani]
MESFFGHTEESTEDASGRKKSRIKSLKTRLFGRSKGASAEGNTKLSQSASDITVGKGLGSVEDLACPQGMMGSRALSHDSIFLADQVLTDTEPTRVLSQENVHSKIKALQVKLQLQKLHFGPPPMVLPARHTEELESHSEDSLFHISDDTSTEGILNRTTSQPASSALSPIPKSAPTKSLPQTPLHPLSFPTQPNSSASTVEAPLDFSTPAQFTASLDISAARHRMSVKPRNQRASTKKKVSSLSQSESPLNTLNNISVPEPVKEQEQLAAQKEETVEAEKEVVDIPQHLPSKSAEVSPVSAGEAPELSSQSFSQKNHNLPGTGTSQVLRARSQRHVATASSGRPHSSFIESEMSEKREAFLEKQDMPYNKRSSLKKTGMTEISSEQLPRTSRSYSANQQLHGEGETTRGPRSGSFVGVPEEIEATRKTFEGKEEKNIREKEELKSVQPRGNPCFVPPKSSAIPWDRKDSLKKTEFATASKNVPTDVGALKAEELDSRQELVEEAEAREVQEEQGKTTFGIKLRATSQSLKLRSETASNHHSKTSLCEDQSDKQKKQEISDSASRMSEKLPANTSSAPRPDPITCGIFPPAKLNTPPSNPVLTEVQKTSSIPKEAETTPQESEPSPQKSSSEVSWMSLAMEKTRSLQQLFSSRFPRDFTGVQTPAQPQTQVPPTGQTEMAGTLQAVKPSTVAMQQKTTVLPPVQSVVETIPWTAQSPLRSSSQTASTSQPLAQNYHSSGRQQPSWNNRGFQTGPQLKSTTSASVSSAAVATSDSASGKGERESTVQKDGPSPSIVRADRTGSVVDRAAFLEKRAEWGASPLIKGVELRKVQTEVQTSDDHLSPAKNTLTSKKSLADGRQGTKSAESSPTKIPEKPLEVKWLRKNVGSSSSPSSSPIQLQSMSESSQPSWMEMAKRKSMAWSDKTMD